MPREVVIAEGEILTLFYQVYDKNLGKDYNYKQETIKLYKRGTLIFREDDDE